MADRPSDRWPDIDLTVPSLARIYDFQLGGGHNFAVDRAAAHRLEEAVPGSARRVWSNRAFLARAVRWCAARGIDQFLDLGSGIPTAGNVHEIAQRANPGARVVYVDIDPVAVVQSRTLLADDPHSAVVRADVRDPELILDDPAARRLLDLDRPVAVLLLLLLHVIPDEDDPAGLLARLTARTVPGSVLAISHFGAVYGTREEVRSVAEWSQDTRTPARPRTPEQLRALLGTFRPVPPGVVPIHAWRPDPDDGSPAESAGYAVVAVKPEGPDRGR